MDDENDEESESEDVEKSPVMNKNKKFCRGLIKAHDMPISQIKMLKYNENIQFFSTSEDRKIKIFSL